MKCCFSPLTTKGIWATISDTSIYPAHAHVNSTMKTSCSCHLLPAIPGATPGALVVLAGTRSLLMYIKKHWIWHTTLPACMSACWQNSSVNQGLGNDPGDRPSTEPSDTDGYWPTAAEGLDRDQSSSFLPFPSHACCRVVFHFALAKGVFLVLLEQERGGRFTTLSDANSLLGDDPGYHSRMYHPPQKHLTLYCRTSLLRTISRGHILHGLQLPGHCWREMEAISGWVLQGQPVGLKVSHMPL